METHLDNDYAARLHDLRKRLLENLASLELTQLKPGFPHEQIIPKATYAPWRDDDVFNRLLKLVHGATLVDKYRLYELYSLAASPSASGGDFLEVGVWKGGSAAILGARAEMLAGVHLWLADTFTGVPAACCPHDTLYRGGEHADTTVVDVRRLLGECGVSNYEILVGRFPEDTGGVVTGKVFRFVHIDVDSYESAASVFRWVYPRVCRGGLIVFDDYGFWGCEGVTAFVNELRNEGITVIQNLNGHAIIPKFVDTTQLLLK